MTEKPYIWKDDQIKIKSSFLFLFSAPFILWQTALLGFSGPISFFGRNPIPVSQNYITFIIIAAYLISFGAVSVFTKITAWIERILIPTAFILTLLTLFPFPEDTIAIFLYINTFICVFSTAVTASLACHLFTVSTTWTDGVIATGFSGVIIALLKNSFYKPDFTFLTFCSLIFLAMLMFFLYLIPGKTAVPFAKRSDQVKFPSIVFVGILLIITLSNLLMAFAISFSQKAVHGMSTLYLAAAVFAALIQLIRRTFRSRSLKIYNACFLLVPAGLILTYFAQSISQLYLVCCVLMSFTVIFSNLWIFFLSTAFSMYPTRYIAIAGTAISALIPLFHNWLLNAVGGASPVFSIIYMSASIFLCLLYFYLEPYFTYSWESKTLGSNIKLVGHPFSLPHKVQSSRNPHPFDVLSPQELMVAKLLLEGHTKRSIAKNMCIPIDVEKTLHKNLYSKLNISSKRRLFRMISKQPYEF